jgi:serine-type D-Ala-D-Ala carboxypeptidase (penicillin-binding protein 5/6)
MEKIIFIGTTIFVIVIVFLVPLPKKEPSKELSSPIFSAGKTLGINQWFPDSSLSASLESGYLDITARAALFVDSATGQTIYSLNPEQKLPIASLVKVMTALIALEHRHLDEKLLVSKQASEMEPDKMLLIAGEKLTLRELLYGIFLISANDAAEVLAETTTGNREQFIALMNKKAQDLGMKNTHFVNPTGLDEDSGSSYSTPYDLVVLTRYITRKYPILVEISRTPYVHFDRTLDHQDYEMYSGINLLTTYPGVVGFKTGFTPEAGLTLITLAREDNREIIGVLLGSENRREEAKQLLDLSFGRLN